MPSPIPILHQDEHLIVVDKPAGRLVVSAPGRQGPTVVDLVAAQVGGRVYAVHRLDEDTTGALVLARTLPAKSALDEMFRIHRAERRYLALVSRRPSPAAGRLESRLQEFPDGIVRSVDDRRGRTAITEYRSLGRRGEATLVECRLETGRRNQIRVHMADLGCPVVGDRKYGFRARAGSAKSRRVMLHAWQLAFPHPMTGVELRIDCAPSETEMRPTRGEIR